MEKENLPGKLVCQFCGSDYPEEDDVEGCCRIRCALDAERLEECPRCCNTGLMEISDDPYVSDCIPCIEGCTEDDWWVKRMKDSTWSYVQGPLPILDDSDIPF